MKKNPGGRPSKFRGEYCAMLIKHMGVDGLSYESFAGVIEVDRDTLYHWETKYPKFSDAKKLAVSKNKVFWEKIGMAGMAGQIPGFNATLWIFNMKNRHGWRDRIETDNKHQIDGKLNINANVVALIEQYEGSGTDQDPEDC